MTAGNSLSAATQAFIRKASGVSLMPRALAASLSPLRNASISVMSAQSFWVTCGACSQLRCRLGPEIFWIRLSFWRSIGPKREKSITGISGSTPPRPARGAVSSCLTKARTSSLTILALRPVPFTRVRSTPSWRASRRTAGDA